VAPQGFAPGDRAGLRQFVVCGARGLLGSTGGGQRAAYLDPGTYAEWVDKLYDALEMDGGLEARLHLILR